MKGPELSRRTFLKAGLAGVSTVTLGGLVLRPAGPAAAGEAGRYVSLTTGRVFHGTPTACGMCPAGCGILAFEEEGAPAGLAGIPGHPGNRGTVCALGSSALPLFDAPYRVRTPLRRKGDRGGGQWERVSWAAALAELQEAVGRNASGGRTPGSF